MPRGNLHNNATRQGRAAISAVLGSSPQERYRGLAVELPVGVWHFLGPVWHFLWHFPGPIVALFVALLAGGRTVSD